MPSDAADAPARLRRPALAAAIVAAVVAADQLTKAWAVDRLSRGPVAIVGTTVDLRLARNRGSAFSLFQSFTPLLALLVVVVAVVLVRMVRRTPETLLVVALSLLLGGAIGNLVDRLVRSPGFLHGAVVDFVHVGWWPTFNVADACVTAGAVLVGVWSVRADRRERRAAREADAGRPGG